MIIAFFFISLFTPFLLSLTHTSTYTEGNYVLSSDLHGPVELGSCHHVDSVHPDTNSTRLYQLIFTETRQSYPPPYSGTAGRGKFL